MFNIAVITDDEALHRQVESVVRGPDSEDRLVLALNQSASDLPRERVADILAADPQVVIVDLGESVLGLRVLEVLSHDAPDMTIIAAGPELTADSLLRVIRAGATEYLPRPVAADELAQAIRRLRHRAGATRRSNAQTRGKVSTLFSAKGGVGVTTLAVNLAVSLRESTEESTILLDLSAALGTAALSMGLQPRFSYHDVIENFHRMDVELFRSFLEEHESGVYVLSSPPRLGGAQPTADQVMAMIRFCRKNYSHVVIDAGSALTTAAEVALREADHPMVVSTPEIPALRNLKRVLEAMPGVGTDGIGLPHLILNQSADNRGVAVAEAEKGLGLEALAVFEADTALICESINLGRPAVTLRKSAFRRAMTTLCEEIVGREEEAQNDNGFFRALLRPFRSTGSAPLATAEVNA